LRPPCSQPSAVRPNRARLTVIAALALLMLPVMSGCSQNSSSSSSSQPVAADPNDPLIARVNGVEIRESDLAIAEDDIGADLQGPPEQKREQLIAYLTDMIVIAGAAEKRNLADTPDFKRRQAIMRNKLLMAAMLQAHAKTQMSEEELRKVYDEAVKPMATEEEVRARHILVETEDEAKAVAQQIRGGADFEALAKEKSKDPGSAEKGGDLGYFTKGLMVPEFSEVAFKMYAGQVSNPVKSQFGWHIIKVEDRRTRPVPEFEQVRSQIEAYVGRRAQSELIAQLRETAKIERLDRPARPMPPMTLPPANPAADPANPANPAKK